eukprot:CAMPEP_0181140884 /NCGR_PEP_ID=MMETSP1071-20121207/35534_1 /TAXON_ID=35127 /ORGANISM="Thalassiosira sp., Strain NH16" /LENGTH=564 /DNA_ID=CAMNT_0023227849 /DNA_START=62 /DNA_END=1756 /DNA_ORIENTATION=+
MGFDIRTSGSGVMQVIVASPESDQICSGINLKTANKVAPMSMEVDDPIKKPPHAKAQTPADDDTDGDSSREDSSAATRNNNIDIVSCNNKSTAPDAQDQNQGGDGKDKHDTIFNSKISFPLNLTRMLEAAKEMGKEDIIHWSDDEKSFVIADIDKFLSEVLPKYFKSSENTKIRSFYRKLNRWGFSMSRKRVNNPKNVWSHPEFHRDTAVKALSEALESGKAIDFLNMMSISRGRKRRPAVASNEEGGNREDENLDLFAMPQQLDASFTSIASGLVSESTSISSILSTATGGLSRSCSQQGWVGGNMANIASMPTLTTGIASLTSLNKRGKLAHSLTTKLQNHHPQQRQGDQQRRLLTQSVTASNLERARSQMTGQDHGSSNATFDLITSPQTRGGASTSVISLLNSSSSRSSNAASNLMSTSIGLNLLTGEGNANATFDLSSVSSSGLSGMMSTSTYGTGPSPNIFAQRAQEVMSAHNIERPSDNVFGGHRSTFPNGTRHFSSTMSVREMTFSNRQLLQSEMTRDEDKELKKFFGNFAEALPPPQEDDDNECCEPNPLPAGTI